VGVANFFLDQSIGIDENNTFQLKKIKDFLLVNFENAHLGVKEEHENLY